MIMRLGTDSSDYHILQHAAEQIKNVQGIVLEIGVREGGSIQYIIDGLIETQNFGRVVIGLDPYGDLPYEWKEGKIAPWTYSNDMKKRATINLYNYVLNKNVELNLLYLTDTEYFKRFSDGYPVYMLNQEFMINNYALVHFDGPHSVNDIRNEVLFFIPRSTLGSIFVFDDIEDFYDHNQIHNILTENNFEVLLKGDKKMSYRKVK